MQCQPRIDHSWNLGVVYQAILGRRNAVSHQIASIQAEFTPDLTVAISGLQRV